MKATKNKSATHNNCYYTLHQTKDYAEDGLIILCIHGIGESGLCFKEAATNAGLLKLGTVVIPDLPGFGASCHANIGKKISYSDRAVNFLLHILKKVAKKNNKIALLSHSAGNIIALNLIPHIQDRLIAYIDLDGLYEKEEWRYSSYVNQHKSAYRFYAQAHKNLMKEIQSMPTEYLLRYYSSFIRCKKEAFYQYAKAACIFLNTQQSYLAFAKAKHLFISSQKIRGGLIDFLAKQSIQTEKMEHLSHWVMIEEPFIVYDKSVKWIVSCIEQEGMR